MEPGGTAEAVTPSTTAAGEGDEPIEAGAAESIAPPVAVGVADGAGPVTGGAGVETRAVTVAVVAGGAVAAGDAAATQTPAGDGGVAGTPDEGTYRKPSASPSPSVRVEMPTFESCHAPPARDTKTAQYLSLPGQLEYLAGSPSTAHTASPKPPKVWPDQAMPEAFRSCSPETWPESKETQRVTTEPSPCSTTTAA